MCHWADSSNYFISFSRLYLAGAFFSTHRAFQTNMLGCWRRSPRKNQKLCIISSCYPSHSAHTRYNYCNIFFSSSLSLLCSIHHTAFISYLFLRKSPFIKQYFRISLNCIHRAPRDDEMNEFEATLFFALLALAALRSGEWNVRNRNHHQSNDYRPNTAPVEEMLAIYRLWKCFYKLIIGFR